MLVVVVEEVGVVALSVVMDTVVSSRNDDIDTSYNTIDKSNTQSHHNHIFYINSYLSKMEGDWSDFSEFI